MREKISLTQTDIGHDFFAGEHRGYVVKSTRDENIWKVTFNYSTGAWREITVAGAKTPKAAILAALCCAEPVPTIQHFPNSSPVYGSFAKVDAFKLENERRKLTPRTFENDETTQTVLFAGLDCLAGQSDLFPTDGQ